MKRTTTRRRRQTRVFMESNRRLFPLAGLFLLGVLIGVLLYCAANRAVDWSGLLTLSPVEGDWRGWLAALWDRVFSAVLLLGILFLLGLSPCGAPFALAVPLFHGLGLGLLEAYYYSGGLDGVLTAAVIVMPHGLLTAAVLCAATVESLRLSAGLGRQLLPTGADGGLWSVFRVYYLRFLLFLPAVIAVGLADILVRVIVGRWLPG